MSGRIAKIDDITVYNYRFRLQIQFTHWVKLQAVILLSINDLISMDLSHICQSNFADTGNSYYNIADFRILIH